MSKQRMRLTKEGKIVIGPEVSADAWDDKKAELDKLHFRKIDLSDEVFIVDADTVKGNRREYDQNETSTGKEIAYAKGLGLPVSYLSQAIPTN